MKPLRKHPPLQVVLGAFTKKEAGQRIASGAPHVHSTCGGKEEPLSRATIDVVGRASVATYPWESTSAPVRLARESAKRQDFIQEALAPYLPLKRDLREKLEIIMEELLTNAIFHGYRNSKGEPRYQRRESVRLPEADAVQVRFEARPEGVYLCVKDAAGTLGFESIRESFGRCYSSNAPELHTKESGAGLGWYMIFETATHVKIVVEEGVATEVSIWIDKKTNQAPNEFSFNFFVRRKA